MTSVSTNGEINWQLTWANNSVIFGHIHIFIFEKFRYVEQGRKNHHKYDVVSVKKIIRKHYRNITYDINTIIIAVLNHFENKSHLYLFEKCQKKKP